MQIEFNPLIKIFNFGLQRFLCTFLACGQSTLNLMKTKIMYRERGDA